LRKQAKRIFFLCFLLHAEYGVQPKTLFQETNEGHTQIRQVRHYGRRVRRAAKNTFQGNGRWRRVQKHFSQEGAVGFALKVP